MEKRRFGIFAALVLCLSLIAVACSSGGGGDSPASSSAKAITAFSLDGVAGTINETAKTISVTMPYGTNVTALVATFVTTGSSVKVGTTVQVSGTTQNNFTSPVTYTVTAADSTTAAYTVTVTVRLSAINLPKTGQIVSYGTGTIDDGGLQRGVAWPDPRFTVGTGAEADCVTDNLTGLMWVKMPDSTTRAWQVALDYADGLDLCGHTDWRLPNRKELRSLANYGVTSTDVWLNSQGFSNAQAVWYWSSTTYAGNTTRAWFVDMFDGDVDFDGKSLNVYVWPVRSGQ